MVRITTRKIKREPRKVAVRKIGKNKEQVRVLHPKKRAKGKNKNRYKVKEGKEPPMSITDRLVAAQQWEQQTKIGGINVKQLSSLSRGTITVDPLGTRSAEKYEAYWKKRGKKPPKGFLGQG